MAPHGTRKERGFGEPHVIFLDDMSKKNNNLLLTYQVLHLSQIDLSQSAFYADHLCSQQMHHEPWEIDWKEYWHQMAYMTAMIISYSRPFSPGRGLPNFPSKLLKDLTVDEKSLHEQLLSLRNRIYAHTDLDFKKVRPIIHNGIPTAIESHPQLRMTASEIKNVRKLIQKISIAIQDKISEISCNNREMFTVYEDEKY